MKTEDVHVGDEFQVVNEIQVYGGVTAFIKIQKGIRLICESVLNKNENPVVIFSEKNSGIQVVLSDIFLDYLYKIV